MKDSSEELKVWLLNHKDSTRVKVRFNDTDAMGVVHFKNYMVYFDDRFVSFMNSLGASKPVERFIHEGIALGVKHVDITYEASAKFGDYVIVETSIEKLGNKSMTLLHEIFRESNMDILAVVKATRFAMDLKGNKLLSIMDFFSNFLEAHE